MENCRHCGSERIIKTGHRDGQQKWRCKDCGKFQGEKDRREKYLMNSVQPTQAGSLKICLIGIAKENISNMHYFSARI